MAYGRDRAEKGLRRGVEEREKERKESKEKKRKGKEKI
jgi:hypothetical protein